VSKKSPPDRKNNSVFFRLRVTFIFLLFLVVSISGLVIWHSFGRSQSKNISNFQQEKIIGASSSDKKREDNCAHRVKECPDGTHTWRKGEACEYFACHSQIEVLSKSEVRNNIQKVIRPHLLSTIDKNERPDWIDFRVLVTDEDIKLDGGYAFSTIYTEPVVSHPERYTEIIGGIMLVMTLKDSSGIHSYAESQAEFWQPFFEAPDSVVSQSLKQLYEENRPKL
jgi:hypothetical protein